MGCLGLPIVLERGCLDKRLAMCLLMLERRIGTQFIRLLCLLLRITEKVPVLWAPALRKVRLSF